MQPRKGDSLNSFIQGSVWMWKQSGSKQPEHKRGVQSSGRPVLVISNNTFNQFSPSVNCLAITSVLKDSPVHVLITLDVESHILCEQIHTISKDELSEYKGVVSPLTLANAKAKLSLQFDMATDRSIDILTNINNSINLLNERAADGFGVSAIAGEMAGTLVKIHECFNAIQKELAELQTAQNLQVSKNIKEYESPKIENTEQTDTPEVAEAIEDEKKRSRREYTDEDIAFLIDTNNTIDEVILKLGLKDKPMAYRMRSYYKRKTARYEVFNQAEPGDDAVHIETGTESKIKPRGKRRVYSDDEKQFIVDPANSTEDIMTMFDYKDKATAYKMRAYFKKQLSAASAGERVVREAE